MFDFKNLVRFQSDGNQGSNLPPAPKTWDEYLASLPEEQRETVKGFYTAQNQALLNTVKATRDERDQMASDLRDAAKKAEKGSKAETDLLEQANKLDEANKRADFFAEASGKECKNAKAAWALAKSDNLFNKAGLPDWEAIKTSAPELFGPVIKPKPKGGAGAGTDKEPAGQSINDFIRTAAGAKTIQSE